MSVLTPIDFCHAWVIFGPLVDKNTRKGELVELPASDTWGLSFIRIRSLPLKSFLDFFSCDQAALQMVFSVCLSVRPSVRPSVCLSVCPSVRPSVRHTFSTMFPSLYHHEIFRSYYQWQKWRPCKGPRSEVKVTEVTTLLYRFRTATPVWIHVW